MAPLAHFPPHTPFLNQDIEEIAQLMAEENHTARLTELYEAAMAKHQWRSATIVARALVLRDGIVRAALRSKD